MSSRDKLILLCAPLTVLIEWTTFLIVINTYPFDFNHPFSAIPYDYPSMSVLFGLTLSLAGLSFAVFTLALRPYWKDVFRFSLICAILMILAGWAQYNPNGGFWHTVHAGSANLFGAGYLFIMFQIAQRSRGVLQQASRIFLAIATLCLVGVILTTNVFHANAGRFQFVMLLTAQAWALFTAYYLWKRQPTTQ